MWQRVLKAMPKKKNEEQTMKRNKKQKNERKCLAKSVPQKKTVCGAWDEWEWEASGQAVVPSAPPKSKFAAHQMRIEFILFRTPSSSSLWKKPPRFLLRLQCWLSLPVEKRNFSRLVAL